jgi:hypothetical protein
VRTVLHFDAMGTQDSLVQSKSARMKHVRIFRRQLRKFTDATFTRPLVHNGVC